MKLHESYLEYGQNYGDNTLPYANENVLGVKSFHPYNCVL